MCGTEGTDRRVLVRVIAVVFGLLALVAFVLRCVARLSAYGTRSWGPDDWVMTLTMVNSTGLMRTQNSLLRELTDMD